MGRFLVLLLVCVIGLRPAGSAQFPQRLEDCSPIPSLAQDIEMRREDARKSQHQESPELHIKVTKLTFRGQTAIPPDQVKQITQSLTERTYNDDSQWLRELSARIKDAWQHLGYFKFAAEDPRTLQLAETPLEKRIALSVTVDAGRLYRLDKMTFAGGTQFSPGEVRAFFPIQDGDVFDTHALQQGLENLRRAYGARGFINFTAVPSFAIDDSHGLIALNLDFDEGKQFHFGEVKVLGVNQGLAQALLRQSGLERGNIFNWALLEKFSKDNVLVLPKDAGRLEDVTQRSVNEEQATIDLTMDFRGCPQVPEP